MAMNKLKTIVLSLFAVVAVVVTASFALASNPWQPYSGVNTIGTIYSTGVNPGYVNSYGGGFYPYATNARGGGFVGWGTEFLTGLRPAVYTPVPIVNFPKRVQPACTWPCLLNGYGYPRAQGRYSSSYPFANYGGYDRQYNVN